jgi:hypothetical protein
MDRWLYRLGYILEWVNDSARSAAETLAEEAAPLAGAVDDRLDLDDLGVEAPALALGNLAAAWAAARFLPAGEVNWRRAALAGVAGTLLYDLAMTIDERLLEGRADTIGPLGAALTDDPEMQRWAGWAVHYAAGVGLAAFYARYLYHRIPGPPVARGAAFGLLDGATGTWGGLLPLLGRVAPDLAATPFSSLAHPGRPTARTLARSLAYGIGVGLVYRQER